MFEELGLKVTSFIGNLGEYSRKGTGHIFIPLDRHVREVSEALLIEGALPSEINRVLIPIMLERREEVFNLNERDYWRRLSLIREAMSLEGVDYVENAEDQNLGYEPVSVFNEIRLASLEYEVKRPRELLSSPGFRPVDLSDYSRWS